MVRGVRGRWMRGKEGDCIVRAGRAVSPTSFGVIHLQREGKGCRRGRLVGGPGRCAKQRRVDGKAGDKAVGEMTG